MKKNVIILMLIIVSLLIILALFFVSNINTMKKNNLEIKAFNLEYEEYNKDEINGLDVTTVMNKAVSNNEKFFIEKDQDGYYVDSEDRVEIFIVFDDKAFPMERVYKVGVESFIRNFNSVPFRCVNVSYHNSGKIASMTFEAKKY